MSQNLPSETTRTRHRYVWWTTAVAIAGALGLGNGVWSNVTSPALTWIRDAILNAVTLGIQYQKDSVYLDAARGPHDHIATTILVLLLAFLSFGLTTLTGKLIGLLRIAREVTYPASPGLLSRASASVENLMGFNAPTPVPAYTRTRVFVILFSLFIVFSTGVVLTRSITGIYCTAALSYYQQMRTIVAPHVSPMMILEFDAQFATIQTRADYVALLTRLDNEARKHSTKVPKFNVW
jgi:hypothetical protein